jgi:hypothetical protein
MIPVRPLTKPHFFYLKKQVLFKILLDSTVGFGGLTG